MRVKPRCASCNSDDVGVHEEDQVFKYGVEPNTTELRACVKIYYCEGCGLSFVDHESEVARDKSVYNYLNNREK